MSLVEMALAGFRPPGPDGFGWYGQRLLGTGFLLSWMRAQVDELPEVAEAAYGAAAAELWGGLWVVVDPGLSMRSAFVRSARAATGSAIVAPVCRGCGDVVLHPCGAKLDGGGVCTLPLNHADRIGLVDEHGPVCVACVRVLLETLDAASVMCWRCQNVPCRCRITCQACKAEQRPGERPAWYVVDITRPDRLSVVLDACSSKCLHKVAVEAVLSHVERL